MTATTDPQPPGGFANRTCRHCWTAIHWLPEGGWTHDSGLNDGHTPGPPKLPSDRFAADCLLPSELAEARRLYATLVARIRSALRSAARHRDGPGMTTDIAETRALVTASNRIANAPDLDAREAYREWTTIVAIARRRTMAPEGITDGLEKLAQQVLTVAGKEATL